jgi:hypothetical protein
MRISIGYSKNESIEILIGGIMLFGGGYFIGNPSFNIVGYVIGFILMVAGFIFELRVLRKFMIDLSLMKNIINDAQLKLNETMIELEQMKKKIFSLISDVGLGSLEDLVKKRHEEIYRRLEDIERKLGDF